MRVDIQIYPLSYPTNDLPKPLVAHSAASPRCEHWPRWSLSLGRKAGYIGPKDPFQGGVHGDKPFLIRLSVPDMNLLLDEIKIPDIQAPDLIEPRSSVDESGHYGEFPVIFRSPDEGFEAAPDPGSWQLAHLPLVCVRTLLQCRGTPCSSRLRRD